jgi:hypothetical protein
MMQVTFLRAWTSSRTRYSHPLSLKFRPPHHDPEVRLLALERSRSGAAGDSKRRESGTAPCDRARSQDQSDFGVQKSFVGVKGLII